MKMEVLKIPTQSGTTQDSMFEYTVKKGDSLYNIAKKYGTIVPAIIDLNSLKSSALSIGQKLMIPYETQSNITTMPQYKNYQVKKGDTIYSIARENNIDVETLRKDNAISGDKLSIGQIIQIRIEGGQNVVEECFGESYIPQVSNGTKLYTVKKGDSLYKIAKANNVSVDQIINLNNLTSSSLSLGQVLKIPASIQPQTTYTVKKGDNLYEIARRYNTSVDEIKRKNNLSSNALSIGQKLII